MAMALPTNLLTAGMEVYLPDTRSWHVLRAIEEQPGGPTMAWFGMSAHPTRLTGFIYQVRKPTQQVLAATFDDYMAKHLWAAQNAAPTT